MTTRTEIRQAVAQNLEPDLLAFNPTIQVYPFKKSSPDRSDPIVCVYLEEADIENGVGYREDDAQLSIHILMPDQDNVDDQLDAIGDVCTSSMDGNFLLGGLLTNQLHTGWKYERNLLPGWTGLTLTYQIRW